MDKPGTYRIRVDGELDETWSERVGGMTVTVDLLDDRSVTTLCGQLIDQAALAGVLNTLYELHLPVVSVERLEDNTL